MAMRYFELTEAKIPTSFSNPRITDLRDHSWHWKEEGYFEDPKIMFSISPDGKVVVYRWAKGNILPWGDVLQMSGGGTDGHCRFTQDGGVLFPKSRTTGKWGGDRNRYSDDFNEQIRLLLDVGVISPRTKIYLGNWAREDSDAELLGSAAKLLKRPAMPNSLTLFHGTSTFRYRQISKSGLVPLAADERVWRKERNAPAHRNESVYLTASADQAEYYAKKAYTVDRRRFSPVAVFREMDNLQQRIYRAREEDRPKLNDQLEKLRQMWMDFSGDKIEPIVLQVSLTRAEYKNLMADDDFLNSEAGQGSNPKDWQTSLKYFGQVAYRGTLPPERFTVVE